MASAKIKKQTTGKTEMRNSVNAKQIEYQEFNFVQGVDRFLDKRMTLVLITSLILTIILGIKLFEPKISDGGDDSAYIQYAWNFLKGKSFPSWHGSFYPILLSWFIYVFGLNVLALKVVSFVSVIGHHIITYVTVRKFLPSTLVTLLMLLLSVNSHVLYFASQTYTEAFYLLLQAFTIYIFISILNKKRLNEFLHLKDDWLLWALLGLGMFLMSITRNIGIVMVMSVLFFFLLQLRFKSIILTFAGFLIFQIPYSLYKKIKWGLGGADFQGQLGEILLKNSYNATAGKEDLSGMIQRVIDNANIYLSRHMMTILGLRADGVTENLPFVTIIIVLLLIIPFVLAFKKNNIVSFIVIYLLAAIVATFISLQKQWGQIRFIVIYFPLFLVEMLWFIGVVGNISKFKVVKWFGLVLLLLIFSKTIKQSAEKIESKQELLSKYLSGNRYVGFTPDWVNYLKMSEWSAKAFPDTTIIASRKPSMSFIYGEGKEFHGIYRFPIYDGMDMLNQTNDSTSDMYYFKVTDLRNIRISMSTMSYINSKNVGFVGFGSEVYGIYAVSEKEKKFAAAIFDKIDLNYYTNKDSLLKAENNRKDFYAASADSLINILKTNSVDYVIRASLRINPNMKTARTINTVARFLYFVELKYPGTFQLAQQIGKNDDEPAYLYKVNYYTYK